MILPGSTAFTKTLGQQSDTIYTTNLVGNWDPTLGISANAWANQVAGGKNLRRFNEIAHSTTDPDHFLYDGSDDFLGPGEEGGYGGAPFKIDVENGFTIALWLKYNNDNTYPWVLYAYNGKSFDPRLYASNDKMELTVNDNDEVYYEAEDFPFVFSDDIWYYIAITYDGDKQFKMYINGSFSGSWTVDMSGLGYSSPKFGGTGDDLMSLAVGGSEEMGYYSGDGTKTGHVHVYTAELGGPQLRQNFLATHKMNSDRIYGNTYTA